MASQHVKSKMSGEHSRENSANDDDGQRNLGFTKLDALWSEKLGLVPIEEFINPRKLAATSTFKFLSEHIEALERKIGNTTTPPPPFIKKLMQEELVKSKNEVCLLDA